jgi:hypothetical protein
VRPLDGLALGHLITQWVTSSTARAAAKGSERQSTPTTA